MKAYYGMSMEYLFELSGEHPDLPLWEAEALLSHSGETRLIERDGLFCVLSSNAGEDISRRLALSHYVSEHLASVRNVNELTELVRRLDLLGARTVSVRVKIADVRRREIDPGEIAERLGAILSERVKIDLEDPDHVLRVCIGARAHLGRQLAVIDRSQYEQRKNRFLPFSSPISIHPRLARALINLTARSSDSTILDPFCGTGAILIEAALLGMNAHGSDISQKMIDGSRANLGHLGVSADLRRLDIGEIGKFGVQFDCIVTDPPYGRSSSTNREELTDLYSRSLTAFSDNLIDSGRVGMIVPDFKLLEYESAFRLLRRTTVRVHRSLERVFVVLEKL